MSARARHLRSRSAASVPGGMMLPIRPPKQPTARPCARASHAGQSHRTGWRRTFPTANPRRSAS